jgi:hypothetical protein
MSPSNELEPCPYCNRTFKHDSLQHHLKACTAERPLKPLNIREKDENGNPSIKKVEEKKINSLSLQVP